MKVPRIKGGEDPATIVGFEVEQMLMPALHGPHVPRYVARGDWTRQAYVVMERIEGPTLRPRLDEAPLPLDELADIGARVALALNALHRQHVVHLDVKPSNIMFRPDGTVVFVDFGLSRHDHLPDLLEEEFSLPMGTGPYMSPEQVQFVRNDPRSDLFALGVMLYHLATGERPFASRPPSAHCAGACTSSRCRPARSIRTSRPGCRRSCCTAWKSRPSAATRAPAQLALDLRQPLGVQLTRRAEKLARSGGLHNLKRWFFALGSEPPPKALASDQLARSRSSWRRSTWTAPRPPCSASCAKRYAASCRPNPAPAWPASA